MKSYNMTQSANLLGISRPTLYTYINNFTPILGPHIKDKHLSEQGLETLRQIISYKQSKTMSDEEIIELVSLQVKKGKSDEETVSEDVNNTVKSLTQEIEFLRQSLEQTQRDKEYLQRMLDDAKQEAVRHDAIIMQLSQHNSLLLEDLRYRDLPFWRRWAQKLRKSRFERSQNVVDM